MLVERKNLTSLLLFAVFCSLPLSFPLLSPLGTQFCAGLSLVALALLTPYLHTFMAAL